MSVKKDAFGPGRTVQHIALAVGVVAFVVALRIGLPWYWIVLCGFSSYLVVGLIAAVLRLRNSAARRPKTIANEIAVEPPDTMTDEEKKALFEESKRNSYAL